MHLEFSEYARKLEKLHPKSVSRWGDNISTADPETGMLTSFYRTSKTGEMNFVEMSSPPFDPLFSTGSKLKRTFLGYENTGVPLFLLKASHPWRSGKLKVSKEILPLKIGEKFFKVH